MNSLLCLWCVARAAAQLSCAAPAWHTVYDLDPSSGCPGEWQQYVVPSQERDVAGDVPVCGRGPGVFQASAVLAEGWTYTKIRGAVLGYARGSPDAFRTEPARYESGIDAALHLARRGKQVRVFDEGAPWTSEESDPSIALSTYTLERMREPSFPKNVMLHPGSRITSVVRTDDGFQVTDEHAQVFHTPVAPLFAGGFTGCHPLVKDLFEPREDGLPVLSENDESTVTPGLFLCGPSIRHGDHVFCFIYKYRQRFGVVLPRARPVTFSNVSCEL